MAAASCLVCDEPKTLDAETECCEDCANQDACVACSRDKDDGIKLVRIKGEKDLWCRECIVAFPVLCKVIETRTRLAAGSVC
jgi:hypothetical protein